LVRRSAFELSLAVLEVVRTPKILTHIMYKTNVNCNVLKLILEDLEKKGLVTTVQTRRGITRKHYLISQKGLDVLCSVRKASELLQA
jgi:predicted transcriptional regulator